MGYDLYAVKPNSEKFGYFRSNIWYWIPLWNYVAILSKDILTDDDIEEGNYNNDHIINNELSVIIGNRILESFSNNVFKDFKDKFEKEKEGLDKENYKVCSNSNNNTISTESFYKNYILDKDLLEEFANFCINSGGFQIS
jgi:hypothetical protein